MRDGDEWVVNGQKVWNTLAHLADRGMLVARTDPELPKHKGLTYFMVDMHAPGVEVRPLRQITGEAEFNEVYLTDARDRRRRSHRRHRRRLARLDDHADERAHHDRRRERRRRRQQARVGSIAEALYLWSKHTDRARDPVSRDRIAKLWIESEVLRYTNSAPRPKARAGNPGPEGSIAKLALANLNKATYEWCIDLLGADGIVDYDYTFRRPSEAGARRRRSARRARCSCASRANSIEGGTSEIMRNILGERILGLPGRAARRPRPAVVAGSEKLTPTREPS